MREYSNNNKNNLNRTKTVQNPHIRDITSLTKSNQDERRLPVNVDRLVNNQPNYIKKLFRQVLDANSCNAIIIHSYIVAEEAEINIQESTKGDKIKKLCLLSRFFCHKNTFSEMTKTGILDYLNSLRKPITVDPTHRSVGTYNGRQIVFMKFFRWLYNPDEPDHRKRITPPCMVGITLQLILSVFFPELINLSAGHHHILEESLNQLCGRQCGELMISPDITRTAWQLYEMPFPAIVS